MGCGASSTSRVHSSAGENPPGAGPAGAGLRSLEGVPVPEELQRRSSHIALTEHRGISVAQLQRLAALSERVFGLGTCIDAWSGQAVEWETASKYNVNDFITTPLTAPFACSTVELVAEGPQQPTWFVSHAWSHGFCETVVILAFHAEAREGAEATCYYWICTFANNQHNLSQLAGALEETPFFKAIMSDSCRGTISMLCDKAVLFERTWCLYESYISLELSQGGSKPYLYDVGAWYSGLLVAPFEYLPGVTLQLDLGGGEYEHFPSYKSLGRFDEALHLNSGEPGVVVKPSIELPPCGDHPGRASVRAARAQLYRSVLGDQEVRAINWHLPLPPVFPVHAGIAACRADVSAAKASRSEDRKAILHFIAGTPASESGEEPPATHPGYDKLNRRIHDRFLAVRHAANIGLGLVAKVQEAISKFPEIVCRRTVLGHQASYASICACYGHVEVLRCLLAARADVNSDPHCPLGVALFRGHAAVAAELLDAGADAEDQAMVPLFGRTPMEIARLRGPDDECAALLLPPMP